MELDSRHSVRRFVLPVTLENIGTVLIGLVFSWLVGGISRSALAAIGTVNIILSFYTAFFRCFPAARPFSPRGWWALTITRGLPGWWSRPSS